MKEDIRTKQTLQFLKWVRRHGGWWYLICTPNEEHMSPRMMKLLLEELAKESLYEMIFVLLMVHRNEKFMSSFFGYELLNMLITHWDSDKDKIINSFITHFE